MQKVACAMWYFQIIVSYASNMEIIQKALAC